MEQMHVDGALYNKYRPKTWDEVVGNRAVVESAKRLLKEKKVHTFLLSGPAGTGKTTIAYLIAKTLGSEDDFIEINGASNRGIDTVRQINDILQYNTMSGGVRVVLFDEAHQLTGAAGEAMLKGLENPPPNVCIILATTEPERLSKTIRSRCTWYQLGILNPTELTTLLVRVSNAENFTLKEKELKGLIKACGGSPRQALVLLEQIMSLSNEDDRMSLLSQRFIAMDVIVPDLCRALIQKRPWKDISTIIQSLPDEDPENMRRGVLGWFSIVLLDPDSREAEFAEKVLQSFSYSIYDGKPGFVLACWKCTKK